MDFTPGLNGDATFIVFEGQTITTNAVLVRLTYMDDLVLAGDMSQNNATSDALLFAANYGIGTTWSVGDMTHDGADRLRTTPCCSPPTTSRPSRRWTAQPAATPLFGGSTGLGGVGAVPEPTSFLLAALGSLVSLALFSRRALPSATPFCRRGV